MKTCRVCPEKFEPRSTMQQVCSIECAILLQRQKAKKKKEKETRKMKREFNEKDRSYQLAKAQEAFNAFIRERDKGKPCISCNSNDGNLRYDAGHYRSIGAHPELRFEEDNCHKQCHYNCNINRSGNIVDYRIGLVGRIGSDRVKWLEGYHPSKKLTLDEIIEIKLRYRKKLKELRCQST